MANPIELDIPCDPTQIDETGHPWAFLDEAKHSSHITAEAIVLTGDEEDPVLARVISLTTRPNGIKVHLQILPGDPLSYIDTLRRTHLLAS